MHEISKSPITTCQQFPSSVMFLDLVYRFIVACFIFRMTNAFLYVRIGNLIHTPKIRSGSCSRKSNQFHSSLIIWNCGRGLFILLHKLTSTVLILSRQCFVDISCIEFYSNRAKFVEMGPKFLTRTFLIYSFQCTEFHETCNSFTNLRGNTL